MALLSDEPGLVNPAFDPSMEDNSQSGSMTSLAARSSSKKSEWEKRGRVCVCVIHLLKQTERVPQVLVRAEMLHLKTAVFFVIAGFCVIDQQL